MCKKVLALAVSLLCVVMLCLVNVKPNNTVSKSVTTNNDVLTVARREDYSKKVLESRFLNMLNHNFAFNDDFLVDEDLVNESVLTLLNLAEGEYIKATYISDYIFNMYGKIIDDFSGFNTAFPQKEGYVYIVPRGYDLFKHTISSVTENEDGSYTVVTDVEISFVDGSVETQTATSLFIRNEESQFGFNILYCDIGSQVIAADAC